MKKRTERGIELWRERSVRGLFINTRLLNAWFSNQQKRLSMGSTYFLLTNNNSDVLNFLMRSSQLRF